MKDKNILLVKNKKVYTQLIINRADSHNALSPQLIQQLLVQFKSPLHSVITLEGAGGKSFCAGADLKYLQAAKTAKERHSYFHLLSECLDSMFNSSAIIIAKARGNVLAGGMGVLAACDFAYATKNSIFSLPEVHKGLLPMVILKSLSRVIAPRALNELVLTGRSIDSNEALRIGLLNQIVPDKTLDAQIEKIATSLAKVDATTLKTCKQALNIVHELPRSLSQPLFADRSALLSVLKSA